MPGGFAICGPGVLFAQGKAGRRKGRIIPQKRTMGSAPYS